MRNERNGHGGLSWLVAAAALALVVGTIQLAAGGGPGTAVLDAAPAGATEVPPAAAGTTPGHADDHDDAAAAHADDHGTAADEHDHDDGAHTDTTHGPADLHGDDHGVNDPTHAHDTDSAAHDHGTGPTPPSDDHDHGGGGGTTPPPGDDHDHGGGGVSDDEIAPATWEQIAVSREIAMQYPTAADAVAAGWVQITVHFPGIAAHYIRWDWLDSTFVLEEPEVLLYGGDGLDAPLVGVNYIVSGAQPPEGFIGDADHWHEHPTLCVSTSSGLVIGGENVSAAKCAAMGGVVISFAGNWLLHVWCIPGWESPEGVFSHENSLVV